MKKLLAISLIFSLVFISGCIGGGGDDKKQKRVYVTPCNVINQGIQLRIVGQTLNSKEIEKEIASAFVDDLDAGWADEWRKTLRMKCYWGRKSGQNNEYYYCDGIYKIPELNAEGLIKRQIYKTFTVGFQVEKQEIGTWVDLSGKKHSEGSYYYLTVKEVKTSCYVATDKEG